MSNVKLFRPWDDQKSNLKVDPNKKLIETYHWRTGLKNVPVRSKLKRYVCYYCSKCFYNKGQLKGHFRIHTGERPYKCDYKECNKSFTRREELIRHKRTHTGVRPYPCNICNKRFGRKDHLKKHVKIHYKNSITCQDSNRCQF